MSKSTTDEIVDILPDSDDVVVKKDDDVLRHTNDRIFQPNRGDDICVGDKVTDYEVLILNGKDTKVHIIYQSPDGKVKHSFNDEYHLKSLRLLRKEKLRKIDKSQP